MSVRPDDAVGAEARWFPFRPVRRAPTLRLFCFAHAGGNAGLFRRWPALAPADIDICPVQLPGRGARLTEPPFRRMEDLLDATVAVLTPRLDVPFALFGHSLGASIAFELALRLEDGRRPGPSHLFVSARRAPHCADGNHHFPSSPSPRSDAELTQLLGRLGGTAPELLRQPEMMAILLPAFRADLEILDAYRPATCPVGCPITAFGGADDALCRPNDLGRWSRSTRAGFSEEVFPGGHFYFDAEPAAVIATISRALDRPKPAS